MFMSMYVWIDVDSVLQCVAVCCSVLQCVAVCCSVVQCVAVCCSGAVRCSAVQYTHIFRISFCLYLFIMSMHVWIDVYSALQCVAVCCSMVQCVAAWCSICISTYLYQPIHIYL